MKSVPVAPSGQRARPLWTSLRTLSVTLTVAFGLLVMGLMISLLLASRMAWRAEQKVARDTRTVDATEELERALREYHRLGNLWVATREPEIQGSRADVEAELRGLLVRMEGYVADPAELRLLADLENQVTSYFAAREVLEAREPRLDQMIRALRPPLERVLAVSTSLRLHNEEDRRQSELEVERALRFQLLMTLASTLLFVLALVFFVFGVRWLVLRPILNLQEAVRRFRGGDSEARASGGPLIETRELADQFNEMTDTIAQQRRNQLTFLAAVAHDLRDPLSALKMIVQSLDRAPALMTPARFKRIDRQLDRLTRMVGDLLDATRIESGHLELKLEDFDLRDAARAMVGLYAPTTSTHQITLKAPERPLIIHGDPLRIEQVISNLLSNAIKYSPDGGPVDVSVEATGGEAELSVSDRGMGIPPEEIPNLFQPFRRRPSTAEAVPGVGLGLSIVRRIVNAHHGHIDIESAPGVGSTFRVRLPLGAHADREVEHHPSSAPGLPHPEPR